MAPESPARALLPALDLPIRVRRHQSRLELARGDLYVGALPPDDPRPRLVQWRVDGGLMMDEMLIVFGRPRDWTGPVCEDEPGLPLVEDGLGGPVVLTRRRPLVRSALPDASIFSEGIYRVGWCFGVVLLRGEDSPWYAQSRLTLHRVGSAG